MPPDDQGEGTIAVEAGSEGAVRRLWKAVASPRGLVVACLLLALLDAGQLYVFEQLHGEPLSYPGALARNGTFWLLWIPFGWGLLRWHSRPLRGSARRRLVVHGAVAFLVGFFHIALWVLGRELAAHQHFRLTDYPHLVAKFMAPRLGVDLVVYLGLYALISGLRKPARYAGPAAGPTRSGGQPAEEGPGGSGRLRLQAGGQTYFIDPDRLEWVEAAGDYMRLHLEDDDLLVRITLKDLHRRLDSRFVRVSRSALVRSDRIREIRSGGRDRHDVVLQSGARVTLTAGYREQVEARLELSL